MAFKYGTAARFYWHVRDWSPYVEDVELSMMHSEAEHRPMGGTAVARVLGHEDARITLSGAPFEAATTDLTAYERIKENVGRPWAYLPDGDAVGRVAYCGISKSGSRGAVAGDDIVRAPVGMMTSDDYDRAVVLHALTSAGISPGTSVDNDASTPGDAAIYLLCTAITGTTPELTVTVEDSANNIDWATLTVMTALDDIGSERKVVAGLVRRYLRATWTLTGSDDPTATWFLAVGRR